MMQCLKTVFCSRSAVQIACYYFTSLIQSHSFIIQLVNLLTLLSLFLSVGFELNLAWLYLMCLSNNW